MADYDGQGLELHHFYRAMAWLEKVEEKAADVLAVGAEMRSVMKHAYKCGAIRRVLVLRRRFVAFPEGRLQLALKRKALAGQWNDADDDDYSRLYNWR